MAKIVECVPNFSEGRDKDVIEAIAAAIRQSNGCTLLDVDPGKSTNRTVYTFVGSPDDVVQGAINAAKVAHKLIDMTKHKGEHARLGAMDVCPFIPVRNVTMDDCVDCALKCAELLADQLKVPVYLYGQAVKAADREYRKTVPQIREGEYEKIPERIVKPQWTPDFGPSEFVPSWGASIVGARPFLVAYNLNLLSTKEQAHRIALNLRESGRGPREPGRLRALQAAGWWLEEHKIAQISCNIMDFNVTGMHQVFEEASKDARELRLSVVGSQIVGLIPLDALLQVADYYIAKESLFVLEEEQKVRLAIERLGLNSLDRFNPQDKVIEYAIGKNDASQTRLIQSSVQDFVEQVAKRTSAPGGGSVAALTGTLGAALATMAGWLTFGNKKFEALDADIRRLLPPLFNAYKKAVHLVDADTDAFLHYMNADSKNAEEKKKRLRQCVEVPLTLMRTLNACWDNVSQLAEICNLNCISDLQVAVCCLETGVSGAYYNVRINMSDFDEQTRKEFLNEATAQFELAKHQKQSVLEKIEGRLSKTSS